MPLSAPRPPDSQRPSAGRGRRAAAILAGAALWGALYVAAAWPRLGGPLGAPQLLALGALPVPLPAGQWPRLFSTWFIHVDPLHLAGNLAAWTIFWLPWPQSSRGGVLPRLGMLCVCGLGASLAAILFPGTQLIVSAGPSGALLGGLVVAALQRGGLPAYRAAWLLAAAALFFGGVLTGGDTVAHLGGALMGLGLGLAQRARPRPPGPARHEP